MIWSWLKEMTALVCRGYVALGIQLETQASVYSGYLAFHARMGRDRAVVMVMPFGAQCDVMALPLMTIRTSHSSRTGDGVMSLCVVDMLCVCTGVWESSIPVFEMVRAQLDIFRKIDTMRVM